MAINYVAHPDAAQLVAGQLRAAAADVMALPADVSDAPSVEAMFGAIDRRGVGSMC